MLFAETFLKRSNNNYIWVIKFIRLQIKFSYVFCCKNSFTCIFTAIFLTGGATAQIFVVIIMCVIRIFQPTNTSILFYWIRSVCQWPVRRMNSATFSGTLDTFRNTLKNLFLICFILKQQQQLAFERNVVYPVTRMFSRFLIFINLVRKRTNDVEYRIPTFSSKCD